MTTAIAPKETTNFSEVNNRLYDFLARFKQLNELFGTTHGLTEPLEYSAGAIGVGGQVTLVLNIPRGFRVRTYKGDGSAIQAIHREGSRDGCRTYDAYDQGRPFEAHQLQGQVKTDGNYNVTSSLRLTGHMSDSIGLPGARTMRSVLIAEPEQLEDYVFLVTPDKRHS
jgi:hypothetical protein